MDIVSEDDCTQKFVWPLAEFHVTSALSGTGPSQYRGFTTTLRKTTLRRTPLDEQPARHWDLYLPTQNIHNRQTSMPPVGFKSGRPASQWPHTHTLDRAARDRISVSWMLVIWPTQPIRNNEQLNSLIALSIMRWKTKIISINIISHNQHEIWVQIY
jgi:hypothetical protein